MSDDESATLVEYADTLRAIASRIDAAQQFLEGHASWPTTRAAAVETRGSLELLIYGGLLAHREVLGQAEEALAGLNWKAARRLARSANPEWWPRSVVLGPNRIDYAPGDGRFTEAEWDSAYSRTSSVLHVRNPLAAQPGPTIEATRGALTELNRRLVGLLTAHVIRYDDGTWLLGQIGPPSQLPRVRVDTFVPPE